LLLAASIFWVIAANVFRSWPLRIGFINPVLLAWVTAGGALLPWAYLCLHVQRLRDTGLSARHRFLLLLPAACFVGSLILSAQPALTGPEADAQLQPLAAPDQGLHPSRTAEAARLGQTFGVDPKVYLDPTPEPPDAAPLSRDEWLALADKNPAMGRWLSDPRNLALVEDDLPSLHRIASHLRDQPAHGPIVSAVIENPASALAKAGLLLAGLFVVLLAAIPSKGIPWGPSLYGRPVRLGDALSLLHAAPASPADRVQRAVLLMTAIFGGTVIGALAGRLGSSGRHATEAGLGGATAGVVLGVLVGLLTFRKEPIRAAFVQCGVLGGALMGTWIGDEEAALGIALLGAGFGAFVAVGALWLAGWQRRPPAAS
jgi:hypothetical protein